MKRKTKGLIALLGGPITLLIVVLTLEIMTLDIGLGNAQSLAELAGISGDVILGILGFLAIIWIVIGVPLGIFFLVTQRNRKREQKEKYVYKNPKNLTHNILTVGGVALTALVLGDILQYLEVLVGQILILFGSALIWVPSITYLVWMHRVYANVIAKKKGKPSTTPGWAVGLHFIPLANIFGIPFMWKELWELCIGTRGAGWIPVMWIPAFIFVSVIEWIPFDGQVLGTVLSILAPAMLIVGVGYFMSRIATAQSNWK